MLHERHEYFPVWLHMIKAGAEGQAAMQGQSADASDTSDSDDGSGLQQPRSARPKSLASVHRRKASCGNERAATDLAIQALAEKQEKMEVVLQYIARTLDKYGERVREAPAKSQPPSAGSNPKNG